MTIRVVLVDDHAVMREGLRLLLDSQPDITVVSEAADGRAALRQAQEQRPDVLVMDIAMPDMNGIEATRQIRERSPRTQVVVLSMYSSGEYVVRALQAGALGYVVKEAASADVVNAVRAAAAGQRYLSQKIISMGLLDDARLARSTGPLESLSEREREVLQLIVEGRSSIQIAEILSLSPKTVETYRSRLMRKLGLNDLPSLVKFAIKHGLTSPE